MPFHVRTRLLRIIMHFRKKCVCHGSRERYYYYCLFFRQDNLRVLIKRNFTDKNVLKIRNFKKKIKNSHPQQSHNFIKRTIHTRTPNVTRESKSSKSAMLLSLRMFREQYFSLFSRRYNCIFIRYLDK